MSYCTNCGAKLKPNNKFCTECGFPEQMNSSVATESKSQSKFKMVVEDVFQITGRGLAITGIVEGADLQTGAEVEWLHQSVKKTATVAGIEHKRKVMQKATAGMKVGLLLHDATKQDISKGDIICEK